jgi:ArsR family transcriptional regulator, arsenate/arsenite/antimonite-responsive transcriptional repressor
MSIQSKNPGFIAEKDEQLISTMAKALAHPIRISILKFLASQDSCFCGDIVNELPIAQSTVSQHLKELKDAGLIQGNIEAPKVKYCINTKNWKLLQKTFQKFSEKIIKSTNCC